MRDILHGNCGKVKQKSFPAQNYIEIKTVSIISISKILDFIGLYPPDNLNAAKPIMGEYIF